VSSDAHVPMMAAVALFCEIHGRPDVADMIWADLSSSPLPSSPSVFLDQVRTSFSRITGVPSTKTKPYSYGDLF
jgi:hypothetical protein